MLLLSSPATGWRKNHDTRTKRGLYGDAAMTKPFNPDCSDGWLMYKAASIIEAHARELKHVHTLNGRWILLDPADRSAKADYEHDMHLVRELCARARYAKRC